MQQKRPKMVNRSGIVFHHDNARTHTSLAARQKLLELGWDLLPPPPYSPNIAPSDYYLFRSLQNSLAGKTFTSDDSVEMYLKDFFAEKDQKSYETGIMKLPDMSIKVDNMLLIKVFSLYKKITFYFIVKK